MCGGGVADNEQFQFPPLREGRRVRYVKPWLEQRISIPAPARGATFLLFSQRCQMIISIPAPARGATSKTVGVESGRIYFNSRPCARGDSYFSCIVLMIFISIPAPARGATEKLLKSIPSVKISIPAPARGAT